VGLGSLQADVPGNVSRLIPLPDAAAEALVHDSLAGPAIEAAGLDEACLVDALRRVSQLVFDHHDISAVEINPAIIGRAGCALTDVRIRLGEGERSEAPLRRLG